MINEKLLASSLVNRYGTRSFPHIPCIAAGGLGRSVGPVGSNPLRIPGRGRDVVSLLVETPLPFRKEW